MIRPSSHSSAEKTLAFLGALLLAVILAIPARAQITVDITQGFVEPLPIAITDFYSEDAELAQTGAEISQVVASDLESSGLFRPIDRGAFIQETSSLQVGPRFADWRLINADAMVSGSITRQADGRLRVEFRLWDVPALPISSRTRSTSG